jgi:hypothetical protein
MSFFDESSLCLIPSGYKDQKLYAVKPLDGSGDLTFSRASSATRVASNGLIEKVRTNLQTYSQDFSNAVWVKSAGATLTHSQTDPNGGTTASRLQMPSGTSNFLAGTAITGLTNGGKYTHSIYMKSNTGSTQSVRLLDGVRGVAGGSLTASVTTSWQRFEVVITTASTSAGLQIDNNAGTFANDILIAFAQTEESDFGATPYIATTTTAVSVGPVSGLPRLDYLDSTCPRLLLEPQRSNLVANSEVTSGYSTFGAAFTQNTATSPQGYVNADTMAGSGASTQIFASTPITFASAGQVTISVFAKANTASFIDINIDGFTGASNIIGIFNLATGTTASSGASIENYGNGWYRCILTSTIDAGDLSGSMAIDVRPSVASLTWPSAGDANGKSVFVWGFQAEAGAYATSYIPTLGTSVTRVADAASKTGISSLIGQTEGTLFVDILVRGAQEGSANIINSERNTTASFAIQRILSGTIFARLFISGTAIELLGGEIVLGQRTKIAFAYKSGSLALFQNGVLVASSSSAFVLPSTLDDIFLGDATAFFGSKDEVSFNQALLFKTRLSNSDLAALTA